MGSFALRSVLALALSANAMMWAMPAVAQGSPEQNAAKRQVPAKQQPNILFIVSDDLAARLGNYGTPVLTPNIDRLASQGVAFDKAYSQFPLCGPSRASFLTGTRPDTNGVTNLSTPFRKALPDIQTLPQYFKEHGYFSGRVGKIFHQGVPSDIGRDGPDDPKSWTLVINPRGRDKDAEDGRLVDVTPGIAYGASMTYLADDGADEEQTDGKVATAAIAMMKANKDKPFFLAVGFYRPHVPDVAPKKYFDLYPLETIKAAKNSPEALANMLPASRALTPDHLGMTEDEQRQMIRAYYASTSFVDAQVGRVLSALEDMGIANNTIVIFTSDHGYLLGEHGQWMKSMLWDEAARVPLIIRAPGLKGNGKRSPRTVELLDLYPTLTELAGLPNYSANEGKSLVPLLNQPQSKRWTKPALSQILGGRSVRTERYRYTEWEAGKLGVELYDYKSDPTERNNLAGNPRYAKQVTTLKGMLPKGAVESRSEPMNYDAVRNCIVISAEALRAWAAAERGRAGNSGPASQSGPAGLNICDLVGE